MKFLFTAGLACCAAAFSVCAFPTQWAGNGHFYEVVNMQRTWSDATNAAADAGGYLATITSEEENSFVASLVAQNCYNYAWLGGFQSAGAANPNDGWEWVTGEPWVTNFWWPGQPDNNYNNNGAIGYHLYMSGGSWFDIRANDLSALPYVIEFDSLSSLPLQNQTVGYQNALSLYTAIMPAGTTYQWSFNGTVITDATNSCYNVAQAQASDAGSYAVVANNSYGTYTSKVAVVKVIDPSFVIQPVHSLATMGTTVVLTAAAASTLPLSYQWKKNDLDVPGATGTALTLTNVALSDAGLYRLVASNELGVAYSQLANVRVVSRGTVRQWSKWNGSVLSLNSSLTNAVDVKIGEYGINFEHGAILDANGSIESVGWYYPDMSDISNAVEIAVSYTKTYALLSDGTVVARPGSCSIPGASNVVAISAMGDHLVTLNGDGTVSDLGDDSIIPPAGLSNVIAVAAGEYHSLALKRDGTVVAWGNELNGQTQVPSDLTNVIAVACGYQSSYALKGDGTVVQWGINDGMPAGLTNVQTLVAGAGGGAAILTNGSMISWANFDQSPVAMWSNVLAVAVGEDTGLAITPAPGILSQPSSIQAIIGDSIQLSVAACGIGTLSYQWQKSGVDIVGETNADLALDNIDLADDGDYACVVSNENGTIVSTVATVLVYLRPPNDDFANRIPFVGTTMTGSNVFATVEPGEPNAEGNPYANSVWWTWTAPSNEWVTFDTDGSEAGYSYLSIYTNSTLSTLGLVGRDLSSENQWGGSRVTFKAKAGIAYQIQFSSAYTYTWYWGNINLNLHEQGPAFKAASGSYNGLITVQYWPSSSAQSDAGFFSLNLTGSGTYSGSTTIDGDVLSISGKFFADGKATNLISRAKQGKPPVMLTMDLGFSRWSNSIQGSVSTTNGWYATVKANQSVFSATHLNTSFDGAYTFLIPPPQYSWSWGGSTNLPTGWGYACVTNNQNGKVIYSGALSDGTTFHRSVPIGADGTFPIWIPLNLTSYSATNYTNSTLVKTCNAYKGSFAGWGSLVGRNLTGNYRWLKPATTSQYYPDGFWAASSSLLYSSSYSAPAVGIPLVANNQHISFAGGDMTSPITVPITINSHNAIAVQGVNTYGLNGSFKRATGQLSGSFKNPSIGNLRSKFSGVFFQPWNQAVGFFRGSDQYGLLQLAP